MHTSGEWISEELLLPATKHDPQSAGSTITYARRYSLSGFICLATEEDDDGNKGTKTEEHLTDKQASIIIDMITEKEADIDKFCEFFKIPSVKEMPAKRYDEAVKMRKAKKKANPVDKAKEDLQAIIDKKNKELGADVNP